MCISFNYPSWNTLSFMILRICVSFILDMYKILFIECYFFLTLHNISFWGLYQMHVRIFILVYTHTHTHTHTYIYSFLITPTSFIFIGQILCACKCVCVFLANSLLVVVYFFMCFVIFDCDLIVLETLSMEILGAFWNISSLQRSPFDLTH